MKRQFIPTAGRGTSVIPDYIPRVDWRKDESETWTVWSYSSERNLTSMQDLLAHLKKLYPQWEFRLHEGSPK